MSQVAAQAVISKKTNGDDSLSPFTSDDENAKPRRKSTLKSMKENSIEWRLTISLLTVEAQGSTKVAQGTTD